MTEIVAAWRINRSSGVNVPLGHTRCKKLLPPGGAWPLGVLEALGQTLVTSQFTSIPFVHGFKSNENTVQNERKHCYR